MISWATLSSPLPQLLTLSLLHFLWQGALVAGVVFTVLRLLQNHSSHARYITALAGLMVMAACPIVTWSLLERPLPNVRSAALGPAPAAALANRGLPDPVELYSGVQPYLLIAWVFGVAFLSLKLGMAAASMSWLQQGKSAVPRQLQQRFAHLGKRMGIAATRVFVSARVEEALVTGFVRPVVLMPAAWLAELPLEVLEAIVAHELAHVRRWDLWVNLAQRCLETVLFYHPAVWWLSSRVRIEREMCCDELAVAATGDRLVYATALQTAAQRVVARRPLLAAALTGDHRMLLLRRVQNVLGMRYRPARGSWMPVLLLAFAGPAAFVAVATSSWPDGQPAATADDDERREGQEVSRDRQRVREAEEVRDREPVSDENRRRAVEKARGFYEDRERDERDEEREEAHERLGDRDTALIRVLMDLRREIASLRAEVRELRQRAGDRGTERDARSVESAEELLRANRAERAEEESLEARERRESDLSRPRPETTNRRAR